MWAGADAFHAQAAKGVLGHAAREDIPRTAVTSLRAVITRLAFTTDADLLIFDAQFDGGSLGIQTDKSAHGTEIAAEGAALKDCAQSNRGKEHDSKDNTRDIWSREQDTTKESEKEKRNVLHPDIAEHFWHTEVQPFRSFIGRGKDCATL